MGFWERYNQPTTIIAEPHTHMGNKRNPWVDFLMVIMASGIARGRVRTTTTTTESRNMAAILQIMGWQRCAALVYCVLLWYWTCILYSIDTCRNKVIRWPVLRDHIAGSSLQVTEVKCFLKLTADQVLFFAIGSRAHFWLTCWKQGRIVRKPVNANPELKVKRIIIFLLYKCFCCFVLCIWWLLKTTAQSWQTQFKILPFPGLA